MIRTDCRSQIVAAATPLFARKGLNGVNVREVARSAGVNVSMISYYFGGKGGLYAAVLEDQFASLKYIAHVAKMAIPSWKKFNAYIYECGICFYQGEEGTFAPFTASADRGAPECPKCLNNEATLFTEVVIVDAQASNRHCTMTSMALPEELHG